MKVELDLRLNIFHRLVVMQKESSFLEQFLFSKDSEDLTKHCTPRTYLPNENCLAPFHFSLKQTKTRNGCHPVKERQPFEILDKIVNISFTV